MFLNLIWCLAGIAGGAIVSFFISYFFYFKGLTKKRLTYEINTFCIISDKINQIEGLDVKYNSNEIKNLYSSTITIKNIGNSIIKEQDVVSLCPLSILTSGQFLKDKSQYIESYPASKVSNYNLSFCTDNCVKFIFDYIPQKAIIKFSLFHTDDISFKGDLMDGEIITPTENQKDQKKTNVSKKISFLIVAYTLTMILLFLFNVFYNHIFEAIL